ALGDESDMCSLGVRVALPQPEEYATVPSEALEVGMSFGVILAIEIAGMCDAERLENRLVKGNRSIEILDGYEDVVEQEFTSFVSRLIRNRLWPSGALARSLKPKACVSMGAECDKSRTRRQTTGFSGCWVPQRLMLVSPAAPSMRRPKR